MEVAISNELKGKDTSQVQELLVDGKSHNITDNSYISNETKRLLEQCVQLKSLSIVNWKLSSLKNFPHLPNLKKLVLSNNCLRDGLQHLVEAKLTNLFSLNLTHNLVSKVSELLCLGLFENLQSLYLLGCSVCKAPDFSATIFRIIPSLKALDLITDEEVDPFNTTPHPNNNTQSTANNNGINGTQRPPPQHGKLFNMSQLMKDYNDTFSLYYSNYSSSNSYGQHEFSASDLDHILSDVQTAIPSAPPPPSSPKVREISDVSLSLNPAETESTDDEPEAEDESFDENHDEDPETLERIANQLLRQERPTRRAAEPKSRAEYQARQAQMALFDDDDEDEDDDDFNPDEDSDKGEVSSSEEPAQEEKDQPDGSGEDEEEEGSGAEEDGPPSPTSHTSGGSSGSKRERDSTVDDNEPTQVKKQR